MNNLKITTRKNFNGAHGKDFIIEGVGSFFLEDSAIRKVGGVTAVKELAESALAESVGINDLAGRVVQDFYHS